MTDNNALQQYSDEEIWRMAKPIISKIVYSRYPQYATEIEDLRQVAILDIFKARYKYDAEKGEPEAFMHGVALNSIKKQIAKLRNIRDREVGLDISIIGDLGAEDGESFDEYVSDFEKTLSKREKKALELRLDGASNTEIYNALNPRSPKEHIGQAMTPLWRCIAKKYKKWKNGEEEL